MTSRVLSIYDTLAALPVSLGGGVVQSFSVRSLPLSLPSGALPARIIMPLSGTPEGRAARSLTVAGWRPRLVVQWSITDLLLHTPTAQSRLDSIAPSLVMYQAAYLDALAALKLERGITLTEVTFGLGVFGYSSTDYFGVEARLSITEIVNP